MTIRLDTLPNGFRVVTEEMPGLESAAVGVWIAAGGRHEAEDENGIAHFLEHMAFKGTETRSARGIAEEIEDVGGHMNAYTSREAMAYYARILKDDVPLALDVISDIILNPLFDSDEIEVERGVILQEIGQALDTPDDVIFDWLQEAAYPDQPLGRTVLGPADRVEAFGRGDLLRFVDRHHCPGRMVLSAAGAVNHDRIAALAERTFGHLRRRNPPDPPRARFGGGDRRGIKPLEQAHWALALEGPATRDPDFHTAQIYATALGGGMSSRLFQEVRERRGLCYSIFAQAGSYDDTGLMTVYAGTGVDTVVELMNVTLDEMKRCADDLSEAEVERARAQIKAGMLIGLESPSLRAERLARTLNIWGRVRTIDEIVEKFDAVGVADVRRFAGELASNGRAAVALYGPEAAAAAPDLDSVRERLAA